MVLQENSQHHARPSLTIRLKWEKFVLDRLQPYAERRIAPIFNHMNRRTILALTGAAFLATPLGAAENPDNGIIRPAGDAALGDFHWISRPLVVLADNAADPRYVQQMQLIRQRLEALAERDVVVITDTDPAARSPIRMALRPRGFMLTLVAKDGTILFRKPTPWDVREISRSIDKQPLRQQEVRDQHSARP